MNEFEEEALHYAIGFAAEAENILDVSDVEVALRQVADGQTRFGVLAIRGFDVIDGPTVAALLINLFTWIGQIRRGQVFSNASAAEIIQDLSIRLLNSGQLSAIAKERLLKTALEHLPPKSD